MSARIELPVEEMVERYEAGESTYELGRAYGVDSITIGRRLHAAGVKVRPSATWGNKYGLGNKSKSKRGGPLHDSHGYPKTIDREGENCYLHRGCWEAHRGPVPEGHIVHHINEDRADYRIENLACMPRGEHNRLPHKEILK